MAGSVLVDSGFLVALLGRRETHHEWALEQARRYPPPWRTNEAVLSESFFMLGRLGTPALMLALQRRAVIVEFSLADEAQPVLSLMRKFSRVPMSLADACLVRITEQRANAIVLTTDGDFHIYRRHGRQVVPCVTPV
jgi:predicted nucleic acid-binding protein